MTAYEPHRSARFEYSTDAIRHIEEHNCARGCAIPSAAAIKEFGPGGSCSLLALVALGDGLPIPDLDDDGQVVTCRARVPLDTGH